MASSLEPEEALLYSSRAHMGQGHDKPSCKISMSKDISFTMLPPKETVTHSAGQLLHTATRWSVNVHQRTKKLSHSTRKLSLTDWLKSSCESNGTKTTY